MPGDLLTDEREAEPLVPRPGGGRTYASWRRVRLSDLDERGRLRLDAVARYLQDVAIEDVEDTGWGLPEHLWFIRSIRVDVLAPFLEDREIELVTWCSGLAAIAAGRRWSLVGDRGGRIEVDSVWIHLGPDQRPRRIEGFGVYEEATGGRSVSTRLELSLPVADGTRAPWPLRVTDVDLHGHVNNSVYWQAIEEILARFGPDPSRPLRARLDYRHPVDAGEPVELLAVPGEARVDLAFVVTGETRAVASVEELRLESR